ncbi:reprolysin-like metallopeptidase [Winogradskyella sp. MH6]|uniref:reprolysin-like metallopeptidase n=1 Tax=Winogradskyella sp. MH6 TaxID=2929510 RepID=UPI001FB36114|nr:zinc-dependent metalloprotease family protein [Winogradskyella sp. MH6]
MKIKLLVITLVMSTIMWSQDSVLWQKQRTSANKILKESHQTLKTYHTFGLNADALRQSLTGVAQRNQFSVSSNTILSFPNSEGKLEGFSIKEASIMHPDLQERFPEIRSYVGQGVDDASSVLRFSISPEGFNGMILSPKGNTFIEPLEKNSDTYIVFNREDRINYNDDFECEVSEQINRIVTSDFMMKNADDSILRTYRLAVSATGEYTQYHGGTKAQALAAINTTMTRVNGIYEVDFNVTMVLIANTDDVIYTNTGSDPYGNTTTNYNSQLQSTLTSVIGEANYDVGHLFANLQNNGNAGCIGCVCVNGSKGSGWTSHTVPEGDPFDVDYVAHELGHQFGANHTWTFNGNEGTNVQMEPGSGSTIMGYAGITGATDVQSNSDPYFHAASIEQVTNYVKSTSCQTNTNTGNSVPVVNAGASYTIPRGTPFVLEGSATDADSGDVLTYCWEQFDENNASTTYPSTTATTGVAFRSFDPSIDTHRYFPRMETIKTGATSWQWEAVPNVARTLNFRLTVRDNVAGGGSNNSDDMVVSVNSSAGPFVVNSPNTNVTWNAGTTQTVTWDVAGTTGNGVNAANVDIFLSTDGGDTYPITLATGVTNDGSHDIVVPNLAGTNNRIMVRGSNHIFFDISNTNFSIAGSIPCVTNIPTGLTASNISYSSATIDWDANTSAIFDLRYRELGSTNYNNITGLATNNYALNGLNSSTDYELEVRSVCTSSNSSYSSTLLFSTSAPPPCSGTLVNTFPYIETYDSGLGDWTQATGDDGDWLLDSNGTPTSGTGPSDDITGNGSYFYTEASNGGLGSNATAILVSPCFDLSLANSPFVSFYNHMYGVDTGTLTLEITNDDGSNWTSLFAQSGNQGNQWNFVQVDLSGYDEQTVKFRFTGVTGGGSASDIAVDQFRIGPQVLIYCDSNGNSTTDEYISNVTLNGVSNNSGAGSTSTGYSDFTGVNIDLDIENTYPISITPLWTGTIYNEGYAVWIDFNQDGDFNDTGEQVFTQAPSQDNPVSGNITIPTDALFGPTRMRVSMKYDGIPTSCESFDYGEVEDYTVNIGFDGLLYTNGAWTPYAPDNTTGAENALVLDGTAIITTDVELNDITIRTGAEAVVDATGSMIVNGNIVSDGTLTLNSVSDNYSSLIANGTVTGNVRYFRHANNTAAVGEEDANDLIAPPVSGQAFNMFAGNNSNIVSNGGGTQYLFGPFDKTTNTYLLYANTETATLDPGTGYRAASTDNSTFEFSGTVNTGNINVPVVVSGPTYPEWNLVGNPYPSYITLADFLLANSSQLATPSVGIYGYDGDASDGWMIWNQAYSDLNPNAIITPGQGFLVASVAGGGNISFTPAMRTTGNSDDFIAGRNDNISYFKLNLTNGSDVYHSEFYVSDNASLGLDPGYDARTFGSIAPSFSIYSQLVEENDGTDMAIQAISDSDISNNAIIPLGINASAGQQLTISLSDNMLPNDIDVYLEDRQNNIFTLLNDTDYILTAASDLQGIGRFYLRFSQGTLSIDETGLDTLQVLSLDNPKRIVVKGQILELTEFILYDIRGREVLKRDLVEGTTISTIDTSQFTKGVYLVKLKNTSNIISKKLIIR